MRRQLFHNGGRKILRKIRISSTFKREISLYNQERIYPLRLSRGGALVMALKYWSAGAL